MTPRLYNTLTRSIQDFTPLTPKTVTMYVCGPTVYDEPHIGHLRSAFIFDVLRRYLESTGLRVQLVRNVTDVDDKIIEKAKQELAVSSQQSAVRDLNATCAEVAGRYLTSYHQALERLGIGQPTVEPKATEHLDAMTDLISELVAKGAAYEVKGGDVYFAVRKFPGYGRLSNRTVDDLHEGLRVEPGEQKQDPLDFALWKAAKPGEPSWKSPWGQGRPGWHIECTAMSTTLLGDAFDIHGGGLDLIFPHHENEIAQAQAVGKPFARYWVHHGLLTVNGEKMSKSLGNYITVDQALEQCGGESDALKMFFLSAHYRSPVDYTLFNLKAAETRFRNLMYFFYFVDYFRDAVKAARHLDQIAKIEKKFTEVMDDDLNTPEALAVLDELLRFGQSYALVRDESDPALKELAKEGIEKLGISMDPASLTDAFIKSSAQEALVSIADVLLCLGQVLGLFQKYQRVPVPISVKELVEQREVMRRNKDYKKADDIRKQLESKGFLIADTSRFGAVVLPKID